MSWLWNDNKEIYKTPMHLGSYCFANLNLLFFVILVIVAYKLPKG